MAGSATDRATGPISEPNREGIDLAYRSTGAVCARIQEAVLSRLRTYTAATVMAMTLAASVSSAATPAGVTAFLRDHDITVYTVALVDLNGDKRPEALVYALANSESHGEANLCGNGGCFLYVLSLTKTSYRQVQNISITRPPISVLPSIHHGWHDLGVLLAGGGIIPGYEMRLRFDGRRYPSNPSMFPAIRLIGAAGKQVISEEAGRMPKPAR